MTNLHMNKKFIKKKKKLHLNKLEEYILSKKKNI